MASILFHGLNQLGLPVVCVESRQAYQALKSLATHKTDRNDARGLAHLAGLSEILCAGPGFHQVLTKRSPNMMANWVLASAHSRGGIFHC